MREDAKARGLNPAVVPEWNVVAGMVDLTTALLGQAMESSDDADEE
jgi:hypothetical protein